MRASGITDEDMNHISTILKTNGTLKVVDVSSNRGLTTASFDGISEVLCQNRVIEYLGLSKLGLDA